MQGIRELIDRCIARQDDPSFRANAERLALENAAEAKRQIEAERSLRLQSSGVPFPWWEALKKPDDTDALVKVRDWLETPPDCVFQVLAGPKGRGKSFAACWAVYERRGIYIPAAQDFVTAGTFGFVWKDAETTPLLAIDELGVEYTNEAYLSSLYTLLNARYLHQRKTLLVTNLDAAQFQRRYGSAPGLDRLMERLAKGGIFEVVPGESIRPHWTEAEERES